MSNSPRIVILSGAAGSRSEAAAQSKDPSSANAVATADRSSHDAGRLLSGPLA